MLLSGGGNPDPRTFALIQFLELLNEFAEASESREEMRVQTIQSKKRLEEGDQEVSSIIGGGLSRLGSNVTEASTSTVSKPTNPKSTKPTDPFSLYYEKRLQTEQQRSKTELQFTDMLLKREQTESQHKEFTQTKEKIQLLESKLDRLMKQGKEDTELYRMLEERVNKLYEKI